MKKYILLSILLVCLFPSFALATAAPCSVAGGGAGICYVTQSGAGNGRASGTPISIATLNTDTLDAGGDTIYLMGNITTGLTINTSGANGNPNIYRMDLAGNTGNITLASGTGITASTYNYLTFLNCIVTTSFSGSSALYGTTGTSVTISGGTYTGANGIAYIGAGVTGPTGLTISGVTAITGGTSGTCGAIYVQPEGALTLLNNIVSAASGTYGMGILISAGSVTPIIISAGNSINMGGFGRNGYNLTFVNNMSFTSINDTITGTAATYDGWYVLPTSAVTGATGKWYGLISYGNAQNGINMVPGGTPDAITFNSFIFDQSTTTQTAAYSLTPRQWNLHDNGVSGMYLGGVNTTSGAGYAGGVIQNGLMSNNGSAGMWILKSARLTIQWNTISSGLGKGIALGDDSTDADGVPNSTIAYNVVHDTGKTSGTCNVVAAAGDALTQHKGCTGQIIHHNLLYNNCDDGMALVQDSTATIYNNTMYGNDNGGADNRGNFYTGLGTGAFTFFNNATQNAGTPNGFTVGTANQEVYIYGPNNWGSFDYNNYYNNSGTTTPFSVVAPLTPITWAAYQAADSAAMEQHSQYTDALFVSVGSANFAPGTGSPLIGTGKWPDNTKAFLTDVNGITSNKNPPDKGAIWSAFP